MLYPTIKKEKISEVLQEYNELKKTSKNKWMMLYKKRSSWLLYVVSQYVHEA